MEVKNTWYGSKHIYSINYRPLRENSNLVVETVRFNSSICTCGKHDCQPQFRVESRVINIADSLNIKDAMAALNERFNCKLKSDDKLNSDRKSDIYVSHPGSKSVSNALSTTEEESESKPVVIKSLTSANVDVSGDSIIVVKKDGEEVLESGMFNPEDDEVKVSDLDEITETGRRVNSYDDVQEEPTDIGSESKCVVKFDVEDEWAYDSKIDSHNEYNGRDISVNNSFGDGHLNNRNIEFIGEVIEKDSSEKKKDIAKYVNAKTAIIEDGVTESISYVKQDTDNNCKDIIVSKKEIHVSSASNSCLIYKDDPDPNVEDYETASDVISVNSCNTDERDSVDEIEDIVLEFSYFVEDISEDFGIMSVYCNSELHSYGKSDEEVMPAGMTEHFK